MLTNALVPELSNQDEYIFLEAPPALKREADDDVPQPLYSGEMEDDAYYVVCTY